MGVDLPAELPLRLAPGTFNDRPSRELIADVVIVAGSAQHPVRGIVVGIQQDKREAKRRQWPRYAAALWLQHECPVDVLVICPDEEIARWYAEPILTTLDGYTHRPKVLLPGRVPAITSPEDVAAIPALGVLSVAYHGINRAVANAFVGGIGSLGGDRGLPVSTAPVLTRYVRRAITRAAPRVAECETADEQGLSRHVRPPRIAG